MTATSFAAFIPFPAKYRAICCKNAFLKFVYGCKLIKKDHKLLKRALFGQVGF